MTSSCCAGACACALDVVVSGTYLNSLTYDAALCVNCGMCLVVCPHGVFEPGVRVVTLVRPEACIECGACQRNCPTGALEVDSGVGCAAAMIRAALTGSSDVTCGPSDGGDCCGQARSAPQDEGACCGQARSAPQDAGGCCCAGGDANDDPCCAQSGPKVHIHRGCCGADNDPCCADEEACSAGAGGCCG
ncbi:MAG: 4Fe-4S binding protein [Anaerolineae bacterium]|nr:4Fe-4S binding protein [Anaerolineae bacterium]